VDILVRHAECDRKTSAIWGWFRIPLPSSGFSSGDLQLFEPCGKSCSWYADTTFGNSDHAGDVWQRVHERVLADHDQLARGSGDAYSYSGSGRLSVAFCLVEFIFAGMGEKSSIRGGLQAGNAHFLKI
jgi:hypothetical protein